MLLWVIFFWSDQSRTHNNTKHTAYGVGCGGGVGSLEVACWHLYFAICLICPSVFFLYFPWVSSSPNYSASLVVEVVYLPFKKKKKRWDGPGSILILYNMLYYTTRMQRESVGGPNHRTRATGPSSGLIFLSFFFSSIWKYIDAHRTTVYPPSLSRRHTCKHTHQN